MAGARTHLVQYSLNHRGVTGLLRNGGEVKDLVDDINKRTVRIAKSIAPVRTGTLRRSISWTPSRPFQLWRNEGVSRATAKHAYWVHEGTGGPDGLITSPTGKAMKVPAHRGILRGDDLPRQGRRGFEVKQKRRTEVSRIAGPQAYWLLKAVSGQDSNPFLAKALRQSMRGERRIAVTSSGAVPFARHRR